MINLYTKYEVSMFTHYKNMKSDEKCKNWGGLGVVTSRDTFQILGAPSISQEWLKLELSNFVQRETILNLAKGMTNHP